MWFVNLNLKTQFLIFAFVQRFFKESVRYPVWTCRDPIVYDRDPMIIVSDSRDPNRAPETTLKKLIFVKCEF